MKLMDHARSTVAIVIAVRGSGKHCKLYRRHGRHFV